jgi:hypothetical protein
MIKNSGGAEPKQLCLALAVGLLTACGQQPAPSKPEPVKTAQDDLAELHADIEGAKQNPSYTDPSKAGPPIHVDPFPKIGGKAGSASHHHAAK